MISGNLTDSVLSAFLVGIGRAYLNYRLVHADNLLKTSDLPLEPLPDAMQIGHEFQELVLKLVSASGRRTGAHPTCRVRLAFESLTKISTRLWRFSIDDW